MSTWNVVSLDCYVKENATDTPSCLPSAWLNMPTAVETLLDCSAGRMSVDSIDSLGATPLMCMLFSKFYNHSRINSTVPLDATRDGNLEVVHRLVSSNGYRFTP